MLKILKRHSGVRERHANLKLVVSPSSVVYYTVVIDKCMLYILTKTH